MITPIENQAYVFLYIVIGGMLMGLVYDLFRVSRRAIKTQNIIVYIEDIVFWFIVSIIAFIVLFFCNAGQIRGYALLAVVLGIILYGLVFSNVLVKTLIKIIDFLKKLIIGIYKILRVPVKCILRIIYYPFHLLKIILNKVRMIIKKICNGISERAKINVKNIRVRLKKH